MPASYLIKKMIQKELGKLQQTIILKVFINTNNDFKTRETLSILRRYEDYSEEKLRFEIIELNENNFFEKKYAIDRTPTILIANAEGKDCIRYYAAPQGSEVKPFIQTLQILSGAKNYYEEILKENLNKIKKSTIRVMVTKSCAYCPELVNIISQFALGSSGKVKAEIIDLLENPDIGKEYDIETVPYVVINNGDPIIGLIKPDELLERILKN